ncbi:GNAT family N-acetyltransferase [Mammaliicoccus sciuri]|uniref:GNAT family N-acetyltransferase n=1 Tax=Mammaliicoccus sciuri TaxID=1296 RepID=UPI001FB4A171|nr:GNAT family N-acetyltransferase [Mammaliicoccus sciuri]MCJ1778679.1 GNAT family N-acetyltransferase [Mammaliicoccus sciuri]
MVVIKNIEDDATIYSISEMAASSFKDENQSLKLATLLEYEAIKRSLEFEKSVLKGALIQDECIGFVWAKYNVHDREVKIYNLLVEKSHRNKGIATALKRAIEKWAKDMGAYTIVSTVHAYNNTMIQINESMEYEVEKVIMRKKLF